MRFVLPLLACAASLLVHSAVQAGDFYVDPVKGKDIPTAGLTVTNPWKTINYALSLATATYPNGHTFNLANGTYAESPSSGMVAASSLGTHSLIGASRSGTVITGTVFWGPKNGIHLQALTGGGLTANSAGSTSGVVEIQDCSMGTCSLSSSKQGSYAISLTASKIRKLDLFMGGSTKSNLVAKYTSFGDGGANILGYSDSAGSVLTFEGCHFERALQDALSATLARSTLAVVGCSFMGAGRHGIHLSSRYDINNGNRVKVVDSTILGCKAAGIRTSHDARGKKHNEYDSLTLEHCVLSANQIGIDNSEWALNVHDSLVSKSLASGVRCTTTLPSRNMQVSRSILADNIGDAVDLSGYELSSIRIDNSMLTSNRDGISGSLHAGSLGFVIESCTIASNARSGLTITGMKASTVDIHHTIFGANKTLLNVPTGAQIRYCLSDLQLLTGTGNKMGNPGFVSPALGMYQLTATSPAIDAGMTSLIKATKDYEGDPRIIDMGTAATPDIGADEYSLYGIARKAMTWTVPLGMPAPSLSDERPLRIGTTFAVTLTGPRSGDAVIWILGFSERRIFGSLTLPFDLSILGQPDTLLHTSISDFINGTRGPKAEATLSFPVPDDRLLLGIPLRTQALILGKEGIGSSPLVRAVVGKKVEIQEPFTNTSQMDPGKTGAVWGSGKLTPGKLGGSGIHGTFRADFGKFTGNFGGKKHYLWDTDNIRIPFGQTLHGEAWWKKKLGANQTHLVITNGKVEFAEFHLKADEVVMFRGKSAPDISCIGDMRIEGEIDLDADDGKSGSSGAQGPSGGIGSLSGSSGGQGGDHPSLTSGSIHGRPGADVGLPAGHPRAASAKGTGGGGSQANPSTGLTKHIAWFGTGGFACRMTAAGGSGGTLYSPDGKIFLGEAGITKSLSPASGPTFPPHNKVDIGAPSIPGKVFPVLPLLSTTPSRVLFHLGGSGGGGGGSSPCGAFPSSVTWVKGLGGGAGGGHLRLVAGNSVVFTQKGRILAQGGAGAGMNQSTYVRGAGGGGSGGSILIQSAKAPSLPGELNVLGGPGGESRESTWLEIASLGGDGGAGMIRVESDPAPQASSVSAAKPPATAQNVGLLRSIDYDKVTSATSKWYATRFPIRPVYGQYTITGKLNGKPMTWSDDGKHPRAAQGQPVVLLVQSAQLDPKTGQPKGATSDWYEGALQGLNTDKNSGDGFRFMIQLDLGVPNTTSLEVQKIVITY